jgi:hypothetical protein
LRTAKRPSLLWSCGAKPKSPGGSQPRSEGGVQRAKRCRRW